MKSKLFWGIGIALVLIMAVLAGCSAQTKAPVTATPPVQPVVNLVSQPAANGSQPLNINLGSQQTGIWVNGQGKITVTPDIAILTLGVSSQTATVAEAQAQAATAMDKIMSALTSAGVDKKDIQTQNFSIQQVTRWDDKSQEQIVLGYMVSNTVVAKLRVLDKVGTIIDASVAAGGDNIRINGISFTVEHPEQYYSQVRELAMKDAKAKADQIASLAGITLGKPTYVTENSYMPTNYPVAYKLDSAAAGAGVSTPISPGETDITLSVQVTYSIQ